VEKDVRILECLLEGYVGPACDLFVALLNYIIDTVKCGSSLTFFFKSELKTKSGSIIKKKKSLGLQGIADVYGGN